METKFSTADGVVRGLEYGIDRTLRLQFVDWQELLVSVLFEDVIAFKWQEAEELQPDEPFDGAYEILDSPWIGMHSNQGMLDDAIRYRHLKFNFNSCGSLELICSGFSS
jgi:hypothetical protein